MMPNTQDDPAMGQHPTTDAAKLAGIVDQTRADVGDKDAEAIEHVLRQRLEQVGIELSDADIRDTAQKIAAG
jgi:hypothetical protein